MCISQDEFVILVFVARTVDPGNRLSEMLPETASCSHDNESRKPMIEITTDMKAIIKQAILSFVATVNEDGTPNLSPKASLTVVNGILYFADIASPRTISNLRRNPSVEINVVDIFQRRGYRFKGHALILSPGVDEYLMIADWVRATNGPEYPVDHVVKIETTSINPLLSPAHVFANPSLSQEGIKKTYYKKYAVKPIQE
jgi:hypothetical protein